MGVIQPHSSQYLSGVNFTVCVCIHEKDTERECVCVKVKSITRHDNESLSSQCGRRARLDHSDVLSELPPSDVLFQKEQDRNVFHTLTELSGNFTC